MQTLDQARSSGSLSAPTLAVMGRMAGLFGLGLVEGGASDLLEAGWASGTCAVLSCCCVVLLFQACGCVVDWWAGRLACWVLRVRS